MEGAIQTSSRPDYIGSTGTKVLPDQSAYSKGKTGNCICEMLDTSRIFKCSHVVEALDDGHFDRGGIGIRDKQCFVACV